MGLLHNPAVLPHPTPQVPLIALPSNCASGIFESEPRGGDSSSGRQGSLYPSVAHSPRTPSCWPEGHLQRSAATVDIPSGSPTEEKGFPGALCLSGQVLTSSSSGTSPGIRCRSTQTWAPSYTVGPRCPGSAAYGTPPQEGARPVHLGPPTPDQIVLHLMLPPGAHETIIGSRPVSLACLRQGVERTCALTPPPVHHLLWPPACLR